MKKILVFLVAVIACCTVSQAQQGQSAVGVYLNYGNETNVGLGLKYRYSFNDNWRIEPAFDYYFKHDYVSFWDLGANVHYVFHPTEVVHIYPLAGLHYANATAHMKDVALGDNVSDGKFGINLGAGVDFKVAAALTVGIEAKYQIVNDFNQLVVSAGITYCF